jgi:ribosomal protein L37E
MELVCIGVYELSEAKRFGRELDVRQVNWEMKTNDQTCTRGCKVTVELWVSESDLKQVREFMNREMARDLGGHEVNFEAINEVFDPSKGEVVCQACGMKFESKLSECPDCGLCY